MGKQDLCHSRRRQRTVDFSTQSAALESNGVQNFRLIQPILTILNNVRCERQTGQLLLLAAPDKNPGMNKEAGKFARIVIPTPLKDSLIYKVPDPLWEQIEIGMRVLIPLGKRKVTGVVLELLGETAVPGTRAILARVDERPILDAALLQLSHWVGQYYLATLGEVFGTILPPSLRSETQRTIVL